MPSTVRQLFKAAGLDPAGPARFKEESATSTGTGVYIVTDDADADASVNRWPRFDDAKLREWLARCPKMVISATGLRPIVADLRAVLESWWLCEEAVLYIGMTTQPLKARVDDYCKTPIGRKGPHAGGFWVQASSTLLFVFWAESPTPEDVEDKMVHYFAESVSDEARCALPDQNAPSHGQI